MSTQPDFRWIEAVYSAPRAHSDNLTHIAVPATARSALQVMADELVGTNGLVALYVPEGTEEVYSPGAKRGRIIAAVKLVEMPSRNKMDDYFYDDWDGSRRWPIGWPARLIYLPSVVECPVLREHVETLFGSGSFGGYVARFQHGRFRLEPTMRERLNGDFSSFAPLS